MVHGHISPQGRYVTEAEVIAIVEATFARWNVDEDIIHIVSSSSASSASDAKAEFIQACNIPKDILQSDYIMLDAQRSAPTYASKEILGARRISHARIIHTTPIPTSPEESQPDAVPTLGELCLRPMSPRKVFAVHFSSPFPTEAGPLSSWGHSYVFHDEAGALVRQVGSSILVSPDTFIEEITVELEYSTPWGVVPTKETVAVVAHNEKLQMVRITEDGMATITQQKRMAASWEDCPARLEELLQLAGHDTPSVKVRHMGDSLRYLVFSLLDVSVAVAARL